MSRFDLGAGEDYRDVLLRHGLRSFGRRYHLDDSDREVFMVRVDPVEEEVYPGRVAVSLDHYTPNSETLASPRRGYGPRPVTITDAMGRTLYYALVKALEGALPTPSRTDGSYDRHRAFGLDGGTAYIVDLDIAACYEYTDHKILAEELLLRSTRLELCNALESYLGEVFGRPRGLPQMQEPSDRLADAYLTILERKLYRDGHGLSRYVDDLRVVATDWEQANQIVEQAAEYARDLGLILSSEKTKIFRRDTLRAQNSEDSEFFLARFHDASESLNQIIFMAVGPYGNGEPVEEAPDTLTAAQAACWEIVNEWCERASQADPEVGLDGSDQRLIPASLTILREYEERLPDGLLVDIVFHIP